MKKRIILYCVLTILFVSIITVTVLVIVKHNGTPQTYTVTFYSDRNTVLKIDTVKKGDSAVPPVEPSLSYGLVFTRWDTDLSNIKANLDVHPVYDSAIGTPNVFALCGAYGQKNGAVYIPVRLCGNVCLSGFDAVIEYDKDVFRLENIFDVDGGVIINSSTPGMIKLNYVSAENTVGDVDICSLKFSVVSDQESSLVDMTINSIYMVDDSDNLAVPEYHVIPAEVHITK